MHPLGNEQSGPTRRNKLLLGKSGGIGMTVLAIVFLVAVVFAANESDVLGWFIAIVAFGWLLLATFVFIGVQKAARFGARQMTEAQQAYYQQTGTAPPSTTANRGGTRMADGEKPRGKSGGKSAGIRDQKLEHSFKIVQVQAKVIADHRGTDEDQVTRALETINITAANGISMLSDDDGPISGTVVN